MTGAQIAAWDGVAALFDYPTDDSYVARVVASVAQLESLHRPEAAALQTFRDAISGGSVTALQEEYIAAFDFDPESTLYLGWHLFEDGPNWAPWLATLAERLHLAGVPRTPELPDHLSRLLMLIAREDDTQASALTEIITPALDKVRKRLSERHSPFASLLDTAAGLLDGCVECIGGRP